MGVIGERLRALRSAHNRLHDPIPGGTSDGNN